MALQWSSRENSVPIVNKKVEMTPHVESQNLGGVKKRGCLGSSPASAAVLVRVL